MCKYCEFFHFFASYNVTATLAKQLQTKTLAVIKDVSGCMRLC